jgi:hypothetical protein
MTEEFLHHIWKFKLFNQTGLVTTFGEEVEIIKAGDDNLDSGPDFFNARIRIGRTLWAGNVEVHINTSDWRKHKHQFDKAYDNIILHVVYKADEKLCRPNGEEIPTIEINKRIDQKLHENYLNFKNTSDWIPCAKQISSVPSLTICSTIDKILLERLERKSAAILNSLKLNNNNWEETFYQLIARNFGFKTNAEPFELLAKSLPSAYLAKHKTSLLSIEAMLFGQAGMLEQHFEDKYSLSLQNEYVFLRQKFRLQPLDKHLWKFLRLRPVNFPSIRIAQFADLIHRSSNLFSKMINAKTVEEFHKLLHVSVSPYWESHYVFDKAAAVRNKSLGDEAVNNILINSVVPFLFVYGKYKGEEEYVFRSVNLLENIPSENNSIIKEWKLRKIRSGNAYTSQALIQLKNEYCDSKKCLNCNIGNYLLKNS